MPDVNDRAIWRPFTQMLNAKKPLNITSASGALLHLENGQSIIDAISSWWVITHGHCHPLISKAISDQSKKLDQVLFANFCHTSSEELVDKLSGFLPQSLNKFFFSDNGSTAVEVALKMVVQYWQNLGEKKRNRFISFNKAYHGDTVGAMSVGGKSCFTKPYSEMLFSVHSVSQGCYSYDDVELFVRPFLDVLEDQKGRIAGVVIEPLVQGAGGMIVWPKEALEVIGKEAQANNIPIIFDEVMTGFGRTGQLFASDHLSYDPDIICLSKGLTGGSLPLSLTISTEKIYREFLSQSKDRMLFHGHSFTGNPISCAAAVANLKIIENSNMSELWKNINQVHRERSKRFSQKNSVKDIRVFGTLAAIELHDPTKNGYTSKFSEIVSEYAIDRGVFLRPLGNVVYLMPPYSITSADLHRVWDVIDEIPHRFKQ